MNTKINLESNYQDDVVHIPIDRLQADSTYQRELSEQAIRTIVKNFDIDKYGILFVVARDGLYYVVDGQHRLEAAKRLSLPDVPCMLINCTDIQREAELRLGFGARLPDTPVQRFKLELQACVPSAIAIDRIVRQAGLKLKLRGGGNTSPRFIQCVSVLKRIYRGYKDSEHLLLRTLQISQGAWPDDYIGRSGRIIDGLACFLYFYPEISDAQLMTSLSRRTCRSITTSLKAEEIRGWGMRTNKIVALLILGAYNHGRRNKLPNRIIKNV